ncbi:MULTISPECIES: type VII secretion protein EccB [unclassified Streptomyces]|uniref:type VII secretion protein EccB n=1 Tax=unclassified Streptomyces TaxID=2593676 RepID=UPI000F51160D|nr:MULTISPECIES: type VII secretion protein EccB [unclassified Streptomyces]MDH6453279.1 type VII secretion protein EccB [Streptomyces sp. SAI-119]MDH6496165.1 type VII secretion protein EccB [Streptomyces sp. SAI-149]QUC57000.1 type VII secretion protein EccB [Streptomyces sp. A2-16]
MATRRDELNAYSFARRRTVAAFLQPSPHGSEEAAPRPLKTVLPSLGVATLVLIGFGAWGMLSPTAPKGWDSQGKNILVGSESTTRYVLVKTKGENKLSLHPVLNLASAKLLLNGENPQVMKIKESVLDNSKYPMGATVGIPFAPDRLPSADDAKTAKTWALCQAPGQDGQPVSATYVLDKSDNTKLFEKSGGQLKQNQVLYIEGPTDPQIGRGPRYMVTSDGRAYLIGGKSWRLSGEKTLSNIERAVFGSGVQPQKVGADFIRTLNIAGDLDFPTLQDLGAQAGAEANIEGLLPQYSKVGLVLEAPSGSSTQKFIVLKNGVMAVSDFTAQMWLYNPFISAVYGTEDPKPVKVAFNDIQPESGEWLAGKNWPDSLVTQANTGYETGGKKTSCSIWHGGEKSDQTGSALMSVWAGQDFPKDVSQSGSRTYVSPGSGLLFKRITGTDAGGGSTFLVTDTGLRYSIPARNDSEVTGGEKADSQTQQTNTSQVRLGYGKIRAASVPATWADLLAAGPELSSGNAEQAQGS